MKTSGVIMNVTLSFLILGWTSAYTQQTREEVPGDHFSLEGALELFKKSASPEEFEQRLNSADTEVNNLDLNGDGDIDYIKVIDRNEGNVHAFILQAIISERESQDVAVIELEKLANGKAVLQITGDADIYGIETIIEPTEEVRINAGASTARAVVNVWAWPSVQYVYSPYYYGWISPWSWSYRPMWWRPWRPVSYYSYYPRWESYRPYYSVCHTHRVVYAQQIYRPYRNTSVIVYNRHHNQITNYRSSRSDAYQNRGRDNMSRQRNSTYYNNTDQRQRTATMQHGNSNSSTTDLNRSNDATRGRSSSARDESSFGNRSTNEVNRVPSGWQRNSGSMPRQDSEKRSGLISPDPDSRQHSGSYSGSRSTPGVQRAPTERQHHGNTNPVSRERESRPSFDTRGSQRSAVQSERKVSSGSPAVQRSGNSISSNKSNGQKRGRD